MTNITRQKVVTNGCSGSCCEEFNCFFTLEDFDRCIKAIENNESQFIDSFGRTQRTIRDPEIKKIRDMLIFLRFDDVNPNDGATLSDTYDKWKEKQQQTNPYTEIHNFVAIVDNKPKWIIYTCKHFDKENRICTNYENRPIMCKSFGDECHYKGCSYTEQTLASIRERLEKLQKENQH